MAHRLLATNEQVLALLDGETVRVTAPVTDEQIARYNTFPSAKDHEGIYALEEAWELFALVPDGEMADDAKRFKRELLSLSPFGGLGDELWVAEKYGLVWPEWCDNGIVEEAGEPPRAIRADECNVVYHADDPDYLWMGDDGEPTTYWRSQMPQEHSRLTVTVTAVGIEQTNGWQWWAEMRR